MIINCPACATRYDLPDGAIPAAGRTVRCANCRNSWLQAGDDGLGDEELAGATGTAPPTRGIPPPAAGPTEHDTVTVVVPAASTPPVFERLPLVAPSQADAPGTAYAPSSPAADDAYPDAYADDGPSRFAYEPPFVPRRRRWKTWLLAVVAFVLLLAAIAAAIVWVGEPDWLPFGHSTFVKAKPGLVLDFPRNRLERKTLADGTEFFGARGTITNTGASRQSVPPLLIVLRDAQRREVYRWEVVPPKQQLGPGETMTINEAVTDIPRSATEPEIGWKAV